MREELDFSRAPLKTLFIVCAAGQEIRNWMLGDFYSLVKSRPDVRLVVFVAPQKLAQYRSQFAHERCILEPIEINMDFLPKKLFRIACFGCVHTVTIWSRNWFSYLQGGSLVNFLFKQFLWFLGHLRAWRALMRFVEFYGFRDDRVWKKYFDLYKPDAVFAGGLLNEEDITMLKFAKRRGVPTLGMMRSWDNFTSKGFLRVPPDILMVQNPSMVEEAVKLNNYPRERIRIIGFPQLDHYVDPAWFMTKNELAEKIGADPVKRWIVYFAGGLLTGLMNMPDKGDHVRMLNQAIVRGELKDAWVIAGIHPGHEKSLRADIGPATVLRLGKGWEFDYEDMKLLMNLLRLSDITLNLGSTLSLEAAVFDKPTILVGFNGYGEELVPWERKLASALTYTLHYQYVIKTGGVWRVADERELVNAVKSYLANPELHHEGRTRIRKELVGPLDGKAGVRAFEILLGLALRKMV